ncbi:MAG: methyl-accepting chemotaxis protein [Sneathiellaceae bacterium]
MNLARFKISTKVLSIVILLAAVCAVVAFTGISALKNLNEAGDEMQLASDANYSGAQIRQNTIALSRAEFRVAADPTAQNLAATKEIVRQQQQQIEERLAEVRDSADDEQKRLLKDLDAVLATYRTNLESTIASAERNSGAIQITGPQAEVIEAALNSVAIVEKLENAVRAYAKYNSEKVERLNAAALSEYESSSLSMALVAGIGILAGLVLGWIVSRNGIITPIRSIVDGLRELAGGNLNVQVFGLDRRDEIGEIAQTMQVFKQNAQEVERLKAEQLQREEQALADKRTAMNELADRFQASVGGIVSTVSSAATEMQTTAQAMASTAEETSHQASAVAAASEQASSNVQTVASAAEELSGSVNEISRQVAQSTSIAGKAVSEADKTNLAVQGLAEAAQRIGAVVELINQIASQTNLLALNATIEAARAGDAGKGFAVVASEVKSLANETAKATEEISAQIQAMQGATSDAVKAIQGIGSIIAEISEITTTIASAVEEQGAATQEIARNVQQASQGTQEVSSNISGVTQAAGETGAAASQVLGAAGELARQGDRLQGEVEKFLVAVRAA